MINLNITVTGKVAEFSKRDGFIVCGNNDYQITFAFDSEWDAHSTKTARFKWNGSHKDVPVTDNIAHVPRIENATQVEVGVYSYEQCTTTPAIIPCERSILCGNTSEYISEEEKLTLEEEIYNLELAIGNCYPASGVSSQMQANKVPIRTSTGGLQVPTASVTTNTNVTNKQYVATAIATETDRATAAEEANATAIAANTAELKKCLKNADTSTYPQGDKIPRWNSNGGLEVNSSSLETWNNNPRSVTNKEYVDNAIANLGQSIESLVERIAALEKKISG